MAILNLKIYPIKGLQGMEVNSTQIKANQTLPNDRIMALQLDNEDDSAGWKPKNQLIHSGNTPCLVHLQAKIQYGVIGIYHYGVEQISFDPRNAQELTKANMFFSQYIGQKCHLLQSAPYYTDNKYPQISFQNIASLNKAIQDTGCEVDQYRMRDNILFSGFGAFFEQKLIGKQLSINGVKFQFGIENERCKTTNINLKTAEIDCNFPQALKKAYNNTHCGFFCYAQNDGVISVGDEIIIIN